MSCLIIVKSNYIPDHDFQCFWAKEEHTFHSTPKCVPHGYAPMTHVTKPFVYVLVAGSASQTGRVGHQIEVNMAVLRIGLLLVVLFVADGQNMTSEDHRLLMVFPKDTGNVR